MELIEKKTPASLYEQLASGVSRHTKNKKTDERLFELSTDTVLHYFLLYVNGFRFFVFYIYSK